MNWLIDTNIAIYAEPTSQASVNPFTDQALEFNKLANGRGHVVFVHPYIKHDIDRDKHAERPGLFQVRLDRYQQLSSIPILREEVLSIVGRADEGSNDWVDNHLLAAVYNDAVHYLVTNDGGIHTKAQKLGIQDRVLRPIEAIQVLEALYDDAPKPPPSVKTVKAYELNEKDEIFDSLRDDYKGFDGWLKRCKQEQRDCFVVYEPEKPTLAGFCIIKQEVDPGYGMTGKALKLCTFKVSLKHTGNKYGELLLKPVFDFVRENKYDFCYVTAFEKYDYLISFFQSFGFERFPERKKETQEVVLIKALRCSEAEKKTLDAFEYNRRFGPWVTKFEGNQSFVVPIQPRWHQLLFPELNKARTLFSDDQPCGNSIGKAYLCNASIRQIGKGDNLLFYRSEDIRKITALGMVEGVLASQDPEEIAAYVGKRTVYSLKQIQEMCSKDVLAIRFRQVTLLSDGIPLATLMKEGVVQSAPQSIMRVKGVGQQWIASRFAM